MQLDETYDIGYRQSLNMLEKAATENGILASILERDNYKRVWARDGIISGLAGLLSGSERIINSLKITLDILASNQAPKGQIPSNIKLNDKGEIENVSYGGPVGRVDTVPLFVIGVTEVAELANDIDFASNKLFHLDKCLSLLESWDFNNRGLTYVPQSGDWADEQVFHGYILYDQLLKLWALRNYAVVFENKTTMEKAEKLKEIIEVNFFPTVEKKDSSLIYNKKISEKLLNRKERIAPYAITPSSYYGQFDFLGHSLAILLDIPSKEMIPGIVDYGESKREKSAIHLAPNIFPPINESDVEWYSLQNNYSIKFRNYPFEYQNGGCWPIINGWWGISLINSGFTNEGKNVLGELNKFNNFDEDWSFYEFGNYQTGMPGGTKYFSWSAAGALFIYSYLNAKRLFMGSRKE
jgi:hypothetical protein